MSRFRTPRHREISNDAADAGNGWTLDFFETNTTTRKDTFSDAARTTANANPVVADSAGRFGDIHLESGTYRVILKDADGVTIWDADPVEGAAGSAGGIDDVDSNATLSLSDNSQTKAVDASSTGITITLLDVATAGDGFEVTIKKVDSSTNTVTIDGNGAETIDGVANYVLSEQYESVTLRCDGDEWHVRNDHRWSPVTTRGDIIRGDSNGIQERLGVGSSNQALISDGTDTLWGSAPPAGSVLAWLTGTAPDGWLLCDGSAVSRTTHADLFSVIGVTFGNGDGSTTFNLPDFQGEFLRGTDNGAGNDPDAGSRTDRGDGTTGDNVGTKQSDEFKLHGHPWNALDQNVDDNFTGAGGIASRTVDQAVRPAFDGTPSGTQGEQIGGSGGDETRPRNVYVNWIIKT